MANLNGEQSKRLHYALLDAFRTRDDLARMVRFGLNENLDSITQGANQSAIVFELIQWAEAAGRTNELINRAIKQRPRNQSLQNVAHEIQRTEAEGRTNELINEPIQDGPNVAQEIKVQWLRSQIASIVTTATILLLLGIILFIWLGESNAEASTFNFESGTNEGNWQPRYEGEDLLGTSPRPDDGHAYAPGKWSLAFSFDLHEEPLKPKEEQHFIKAQLKYEASDITLMNQLSAWVYILPTAPDDLLASCFILEHKTQYNDQDPRAWLWYQTGYTQLRPDSWTQVMCRDLDFQAKLPNAHWTKPLLVGFEFKRKNDGPYQGTVYLDKILLR